MRLYSHCMDIQLEIYPKAGRMFPSFHYPKSVLQMTYHLHRYKHISHCGLHLQNTKSHLHFARVHFYYRHKYVSEAYRHSAHLPQISKQTESPEGQNLPAGYLQLPCQTHHLRSSYPPLQERRDQPSRIRIRMQSMKIKLQVFSFLFLH